MFRLGFASWPYFFNAKLYKYSLYQYKRAFEIFKVYLGPLHPTSQEARQGQKELRPCISVQWSSFPADVRDVIVFQRRQDGSVDFSLYWSDYKYGFGNVSSEHWLGNDNIHRLSHDKTYELRIDLEDFDGQTRYATYNHFSLADEVANYTLALGSYFGDVGDSMWHHAGYPFSTRDRDHDGLPEHCADKYKGGWWYNDCHRANLNGLYLKGPTTVREHAMGVVWSKWLVPRLPRDCAEIQTGGLSLLSGVYPIYPDGDGDDPLFVDCDMETDGGRWTVFQRRQDGSVDFFLSWSEYKYGFGNVSSEHWLGNDNIHRLSRNKTYELRIDLEDFDGQTRYATYSNFSIADEVANSTLALGNYFGGAVPTLPRDCAEIQTGGLSHLSGVYPIYPDGDGDDPLFVYCDMETEGGRWTVFQRRQDGSVDFSLYWSEYKNGFGNVSSEHWLGNDNIHRLSRQKTYELRIDLEDFDGQTRYATYSNFSIADEVAKYILALGNYSGDAGDSMSSHEGYPFSTRDRDHDGLAGHCAGYYKGGWWYNDCLSAYLNGLYLKGPTTMRENAMSVFWGKWRGPYYSLKTTEMKLRST
eukprot:XP_011660865.1 PREDICTED: uncharacterized protein LOC105436720 [Strongylocentrotus purpuratus]